MATQNTNQLNHDEALELLPWLVNSSLEETLSKQVAAHVDSCESCQRESAILTSAMLALNTEEPDYRDVSQRFRNLMDRIHAEEAATGRHSEKPQIVDADNSIAGWFGFLSGRPEWATAFAVGIIVGAGSLFTIMQWNSDGPISSPDPYQVYSERDPAPRMLVQFTNPPSDSMLDDLRRETEPVVEWRELSANRYSIEFGEDVDVRTVFDVRARLLMHESIADVQIDTR